MRSVPTGHPVCPSQPASLRTGGGGAGVRGRWKCPIEVKDFGPPWRVGVAHQSPGIWKTDTKPRSKPASTVGPALSRWLGPFLPLGAA